MGPSEPFASSAAALPLISFIGMVHAEPHKQVASANTHCNINCFNDGYCDFTQYIDYPQKGDVGYYKSCSCRPGFGGGGCERIVDECQAPLYKCHNGAPCEMDENGVLGCDCTAADSISDLAGYMCRRPVIQTCDTLDQNNKSYCTNGGICLSSMTASPDHLMFSRPTTHQGCQCDDAFFGDHCEYIKGMPKSSLVDNGSQRDVGSKVGITLSVLTGVAITCGILIGRRRRRQLQSSASESWGRRGHTSHSFYEENLATGKDSNQGNRDQGTESQAEMKEIQFGGTSKEEGDLQSMLSSIDSSKPEVYEAGAKSYFA